MWCLTLDILLSSCLAWTRRNKDSLVGNNGQARWRYLVDKLRLEVPSSTALISALA